LIIRSINTFIPKANPLQKPFPLTYRAAGCSFTGENMMNIPKEFKIVFKPSLVNISK
jgi:hypothetical protein